GHMCHDILEQFVAGGGIMVEVRVLEELDADIGGFCIASELLIWDSLDEMDFVFKLEFPVMIDEVEPFLAVADHDEPGALDFLEGIEEFEQSPALLHAALVEYNFLRTGYAEFFPDRIGFNRFYIIEFGIVVYGCGTVPVQSPVIVGPCIVLDDDVVDELEQELLYPVDLPEAVVRPAGLHFVRIIDQRLPVPPEFRTGDPLQQCVQIM